MSQVELSGRVGAISGLSTVQALPVAPFIGSGYGAFSYFSGADGNISLNVNISGGSVTVEISGGVSVDISGNVVATSSGGTLPVSIVSGSAAALSGLQVVASVAATIPAWQSGILVGISGGQAALSGLNVVGSFSAAPPGLQSGQMILISGGQGALSGLVVHNSGQTVLTSVSGNLVPVASGGVLPVSMVSGAVEAFSGLNLVVMISGGADALSGVNVIASVTTTLAGWQSGVMVGISGGQAALSGLNVLGSFTAAPPGLQSGQMVLVSGGQGALSGLIVEVSGTMVGVFSGSFVSQEYPSYSLTSYWSGTSQKGIIGIANNGAVVGQICEVTRVEISIFGSGNINRIDVLRSTSGGSLSGSAGAVVAWDTTNTASVTSGVVDGATQISGQANTVIKSLVLESNSSGYMHNYVYDVDVAAQSQKWHIRSGQALWLQLISGIGYGIASLDWIERGSH